MHLMYLGDDLGNIHLINISSFISQSTKSNKIDQKSEFDPY